MKQVEENKNGFYFADHDCKVRNYFKVDVSSFIEFDPPKDPENCYLLRQPETAFEKEAALCFMTLGCGGEFRYGGKDKRIIESLYLLESGELCDHPSPFDFPKNHLPMRNLVKFRFEGSTSALLARLVRMMNAPPNDGLPVSVVEETQTSFTFRRYFPGHFRGWGFHGKQLAENQFEIRITLGDKHKYVWIRLNAAHLHEELINSPLFTEIQWYGVGGYDGPAYPAPY